MNKVLLGIVAGILIGVFARKVQSLPLCIVFGLAVGLLLAFIVAQMQHGYYFQIMLPGGMVGWSHRWIRHPAVRAWAATAANLAQLARFALSPTPGRARWEDRVAAKPAALISTG